MAAADFRNVFMGIETPDPDALAQTQKRVNAMAPIADRIAKVYAHGIAVTAGFILGFDSEKRGADESMIACIEEAGIAVAMVGLLVALPNTQLTRRLQGEGRLLSPDMSIVPSDSVEPYRLQVAGTYAEGADQAGGLNFLTIRDRAEVYREYGRVLRNVYGPRQYLDRVLATARRIEPKSRRQAAWPEALRGIRAMIRLAWWMTRQRELRRLYWRNSFIGLAIGLRRFDYMQRMMLMYRHLGPQARHIASLIDGNIEFAEQQAPYPRKWAPPEVADAEFPALAAC
jgi:hypothetical protein